MKSADPWVRGVDPATLHPYWFNKVSPENVVVCPSEHCSQGRRERDLGLSFRGSREARDAGVGVRHAVAAKRRGPGRDSFRNSG